MDQPVPAADTPAPEPEQRKPVEPYRMPPSPQTEEEQKILAEYREAIRKMTEWGMRINRESTYPRR